VTLDVRRRKNIPEKSADKAGGGEVAEWNRVGPPETDERFRDDRPESSGENLEMNLSEQRKMSGIRPHQKGIMDDRQGDVRDR